ncbi:MAG: hypothetical protein QG644_295 [Patescibacteria group bacterium]|nr:hypothetical protein [Patescibacteria group bacterium]
MTKFGKLILFLVILVLVSVGIFFLQQEPKEVVVNTPIDISSGTMPAMEGNVSDFISLSFDPNSTLSGLVQFQGSIKGAYFFEGNVQINILSVDKNVLKAGYATATSEWMTVEPVEFKGEIDLTGLSTGPAYFEIHNDNASGLPENDKSILIPIMIE